MTLTVIPPIRKTRPRMSTPKRQFLLRKDVARIWSGRAGRPIADATVSSYLQRSKPADPDTGRPAGPFADDPVPAPKYEGNRPIWEPNEKYPTIEDVIKALEDWWDRQSGRYGDPRRKD